MDDDQVDIPRVAIQPFRCLSEASRLITGSYWLFVGLSTVAMLLGSLAPMAILAGPMMCGLSKCYFRQLRGGEASFELLFKGFDDFLESLIASLVMFAVVTACSLPLTFFWFFGVLGMGVVGKQAGGGPNVLAFFGMMGLIYLLIIVVAVVLSTLFAFVYPLIVDRQMKGIQALGLSVKAVWANFWGMLGLTLLNGILGLLGTLCCCVGSFLVLPITFGASIIAYRRVFPEDAAPAE